MSADGENFGNLQCLKRKKQDTSQLSGCVAIEKNHVELQELCMRSQISEQVTEQSTLIVGNLGSYPWSSTPLQDKHMRGTVFMRYIGKCDRKVVSNQNTAQRMLATRHIETVFSDSVPGLGGWNGGWYRIAKHFFSCINLDFAISRVITCALLGRQFFEWVSKPWTKILRLVQYLLF